MRLLNRDSWQVRLGPLQTAAGEVVLRPVRARDAMAWSRLRLSNQASLEPWEPTSEPDWFARHQPAVWPSMSSAMRSQARAGVSVPLVIEVNGEYAGQLTVGNIVRGQLQSAWIGYWVDHDVTGRGVATAAVALAIDHCFGTLKLHRLEATVRPENLASRAVLTKSGFREEGLLVRYMHVDHDWRDHMSVALTVDEVQDTAVARLIRAGRAQY